MAIDPPPAVTYVVKSVDKLVPDQGPSVTEVTVTYFREDKQQPTADDDKAIEALLEQGLPKTQFHVRAEDGGAEHQP